jgi:hypothetical protein
VRFCNSYVDIKPATTSGQEPNINIKSIIHFFLSLNPISDLSEGGKNKEFFFIGVTKKDLFLIRFALSPAGRFSFGRKVLALSFLFCFFYL